MTAITISRQLGSMGDEVAQAIANRLNFRVVSRDLINQAAIKAGVPEMALAAIDDLGLFGMRPSQQTRSSYHQAIYETMHDIADTGGVVIIGRAGQIILREHPDVLHVMVIAPFSVRVARVSEQQGISNAAAIAQIETSDRSRRNYLRRYYSARWNDPELYDLVINTQRLSPELAACLVSQSLTQCIQNTHG